MKCVIHLNNGKGKKIHFNGNFPEEKKNHIKSDIAERNKHAANFCFPFFSVFVCDDNKLRGHGQLQMHAMHLGNDTQSFSKAPAKAGILNHFCSSLVSRSLLCICRAHNTNPHRT